MRFVKLGLPLAALIVVACALVDSRAAGAGSMARSSTAFGLALMRQLTAGAAPVNTFVCPLSIHACLQMVYNGAGGQTFTEMGNVLGLSGQDLKASNGDYLRFVSELQSQPEWMKAGRGPGDGNPQLILEIANSTWANKDFKFKKEYVGLLEKVFAAACRNLDFADPKSVAAINSWVKDKTHGKIAGIISSLKPSDMLVLVNSAYFKGRWDHEFDKQATKPGEWHPATGPVVKVPMMHLNARLDYLEDKDVQMVRLPYLDPRFAMYVALPSQKLGLKSFCQMLTADKWAGYRKGFSRRQGDVSMPRFKLEYALSLNDVLKKMGMPLAFSDKAEFSKMVIPPPIPRIGAALHKTYVDVNEEGTEAAAATAIIMEATSMPAPTKPFTMTVDRPFFFAVVHEETGAILFEGTVANPK